MDIGASHLETVIAFRRWSARTLSITTTRPSDYAFRPGHYARVSLPCFERPLWRPYSIVSSSDQPQLEFLFSIIPSGRLTPLLGELTVESVILIDRNPMGFFLEESLSPGEVLWLLATGTGVGPYISLLREGGIFAKYQQVILVYSVRARAELAYDDELRALQQQLDGRFHYLPVITREPGTGYLSERIPALIGSGRLANELGMTPINPVRDRVMVCGNPEFTSGMRALLNERQFAPCRRGQAGTMLFEKYW
ncbi:ferredoxin--NADP reductase [Crenobacter sp. SG2303]|uniref:ferredoxin--NADP(+) reductase n=1 Tax=Crenobacter oryzisoli TaxID=3056844 RepID=A0ABT7XMX1_9NEIS|nr:ferredoxin--NADP reductase [Crenobacter sp. SG2303]MDN0075147.1 ferredoxin--NADP reductase [Crenobacter sp. SG2303]